MILVRWLTPSQMGVWALFLTVTTVFETTKSGLLKNAHIKFVSTATDKEEKVIIASSSFIINLTITFLFILFIIFFADWLSSVLHAGNELSETLKWFIPGLICMILFSHLEATQQSHFDFKGVFAGYVSRQICFFIFIFLHALYKPSFSLTELVIYQSVSILIGTIILYLYTRKYLNKIFKPSKLWIKKILGYGGYIFGSGFIANLQSNTDQILAATFISSTSVAFYNTASRINNFVDIPSYAAAEIIFPKSAKAAIEEGTDKVKYLYERMVGILLSFTIPAALFIILFPQFVITVIAGSKYITAAIILQLYMSAGLIRPMQNQAANILNASGKPRLCFVLNASSLFLNIILSYMCLQYFGFYGAAIGTLISVFISSIIWYFIMRKEINIQLLNVLTYTLNTYKNISSFLTIKLSSAKKSR